MKTTLAMIVMIMALGGWMAVGDSPRTRSLEQRVADLEQLVVMQASQILEQQAQLDRYAPVMNRMELVTFTDGSESIFIRQTDLVIDRGNLQAVNLFVVESIYLFGDIFNLQ